MKKDDFALTIRNILILGVSILFFGQIGPRIVNNDTTSKYTSDTQEFAKAAIAESGHLTNNPFEAASRTGLKIIVLKKVGEGFGCLEKRVPYKGRYEAVVRAYTWFGIPYNDILVKCDEIQRLPLGSVTL